MPEQISKYPDITLGILKDLGAECGTGAAQNILTECPAAQFCALPTGEICVYGIEDIPKMTQITTQELATIICLECQSQDANSTIMPGIGMGGVLLAVIFIIGLTLGRFWKSARVRSGNNHPP